MCAQNTPASGAHTQPYLWTAELTEPDSLQAVSLVSNPLQRDEKAGGDISTFPSKGCQGRRGVTGCLSSEQLPLSISIGKK